MDHEQVRAENTERYRILKEEREKGRKEGFNHGFRAAMGNQQTTDEPQGEAVAYTANECSNNPHYSTTTARIDQELEDYQSRSRRVVKLEALRRLLAANQDVARILELKAELGY